MKFSQKHANAKKTEKAKMALNMSKKYKHLFLEWFTGLGKSKASLDILNYHKDAKWVIVCKELNHMITWKDEAKLWKINIKDVQLISYASLHKLPQDIPLNLILDEAHALTPARMKKLSVLKINRVLALTATMPANKASMMYKLGKFMTYQINMALAISEGMVPEPDIVKVIVKLPPQAMRQYKALSSRINQAYWDNNEDLCKKLGAIRKQFLAKGKSAAVKKHLDYSKRFVCFTGSIDQCDELGGKNVIHSKSPKRETIIKNFNKLKIDNLFAVNMLRESMNLRDIEVGYIVQLDNQQKSTVQMFGRSFRSTKPTMYVFIAQETVDEKYAETALAEIPEKYIRYLHAT